MLQDHQNMSEDAVNKIISVTRNDPIFDELFQIFNAGMDLTVLFFLLSILTSNKSGKLQKLFAGVGYSVRACTCLSALKSPGVLKYWYPSHGLGSP